MCLLLEQCVYGNFEFILQLISGVNGKWILFHRACTYIQTCMLLKASVWHAVAIARAVHHNKFLQDVKSLAYWKTFNL